MQNYAILQNPGHNRVYYNLAADLAIAELNIAARKFSCECVDIQIIEIQDIRYISFSAAGELNDNDLKVVSQLSFFFALYQIVDLDNDRYLKPIKKVHYEYLDSKISSLMKYQGKTNELFTRMMINVAVLSGDFSDETLALLDPVAGKGTTLFEALVYGCHAYGVEIEPKAVQEATQFFKRYIQTERYKYSSDQRRVSGATKSDAVFMQEYIFAKNKDAFKDPDMQRCMGMINGSTANVSNYFNKRMFHVIVGDLPYGISHGHTAGKQMLGGTRNPAELLKESLHGWHDVLKPGGIVVIAWNSFIKSRKALATIFEENGFSVFDDDIYNSFEHMVDKSIKRDILVAKKV